MTVFDVGANAGYFTLLFSRAVGSSGAVFAFEPDPQNLVHLRRNITLNHRDNVSIIAAAVTDKEGAARFRPDASMGSICSEGPLSVTTCRIDDFPTPDFVKMDIEGGELLALQGAQRTLRKHRTSWFIELHGDSIASSCVDLFRQLDHNIRFIGANHLLAIPHRCGPV
jgi:FkbM family methyltransferase